MKYLFCLILNLVCVSACATEWRTFTSSGGQSFEGKVLSKTDQTVTIQRKSDSKSFTLPFDRLAQKDQSYVKAWSFPKVNVNKKLFPKSRADIQVGLAEIAQHSLPEWMNPQYKQAFRDILEYRFLCGLPIDVTPTEEYTQEAVDKLKIIIGANGDFDSIQGKYDNLNYLSESGIDQLVSALAMAAGTAQRNTLLTRYALLHANMKEIGMAEVSPMCGVIFPNTWDKSKVRFAAYPAEGFFPVSHLHGKSWTLYINKELEADGKTPDVRVFRLKDIPEKPFKLNANIPGEEMRVVHVAVYRNSVIFEPVDPAKEESLKGPGVYWITAKGGGVRASYLTVLY